MNLSETNVKRPWQSKTVIINAIAGLGAIVALFVPGAEKFAAANAETIMLVLSFGNVILRAITKNKIGLKD